jgi:DNA-binding transcriptional LysR family regulator
MQPADMNLIMALDLLLREESVTRAAEQMNLSPAAMSRTLSRIRDAVGDPILVRAGRQLVPTPRALELRSRVHALAEEARFLLSSKQGLNLPSLERTFTIRTDDSLVAAFAAPLAELVQQQAPNVRIRFLTQSERDVAALREGAVDLEITVIKEMGPEIKLQLLFQDRFIGAVRPGHVLSRSKVTAKRFASQLHIGASRRGKEWGPIDDLLKAQGLARKIALIVPSFYVAVATAARSDLVASVPEYLTSSAIELFGLHVFQLPLPVESVRLSQAWHPRFDADPAHRWLRDSVRKVFFRS